MTPSVGVLELFWRCHMWSLEIGQGKEDKIMNLFLFPEVQICPLYICTCNFIFQNCGVLEYHIPPFSPSKSILRRNLRIWERGPVWWSETGQIWSFSKLGPCPYLSKKHREVAIAYEKAQDQEIAQRANDRVRNRDSEKFMGSRTVSQNLQNISTMHAV